MKLKMNCAFISLLLISLTASGQSMKQEKISPKELSTWKTLDKGKSTLKDDALIIEETEGANGYFLISPKSYKGDFVVRYKVKALSESSVIITLFFASQKENIGELILPASEAPSEEFWKWRSNMQHYNLTFNNRSHNYKPFFLKNLSPLSRGFYETLPDNITQVGQWYEVEIGKKDNRLWFNLDGKTHFDIEDCNPLKEGHLIFRISGTTGEETILAKIALKDIVIRSN